MCACNGTGGIKTVGDWSATFAPCPDTNCQFDSDKAWNEYQAWRTEFFKQLKEVSA